MIVGLLCKNRDHGSSLLCGVNKYGVTQNVHECFCVKRQRPFGLGIFWWAIGCVVSHPPNHIKTSSQTPRHACGISDSSVPSLRFSRGKQMRLAYSMCLLHSLDLLVWCNLNRQTSIAQTNYRKERSHRKEKMCMQPCRNRYRDGRDIAPR